jgi:hypothetical protein
MMQVPLPQQRGSSLTFGILHLDWVGACRPEHIGAQTGAGCRACAASPRSAGLLSARGGRVFWGAVGRDGPEG